MAHTCAGVVNAPCPFVPLLASSRWGWILGRPSICCPGCWRQLSPVHHVGGALQQPQQLDRSIRPWIRLQVSVTILQALIVYRPYL
jgi:hypothetical protein